MSDALSTAAPAAAAEINEAIDPSIEATKDESIEDSSEETPVSGTAKVADVLAKKSEGEKLTKKEEKILKEYKLKVNGKDEIIKFDPTNEEEVKSWLQKGRASDQKFQEAAEVRKAAMSFIEELRKNPKKILSDPSIGVDLKKFAAELMDDQIKEMEKSPEQKEREKLQKELQELKDSRDKEKKDFESKERARMDAEHERQIESDISTALDVGGLPKTPRTVRTMADYMMIALENGINLTANEIIPIVKSTTLGEFKEVVSSLSDDQLEDFLGKEVLGRLRKKNVAKAKAVETANSVRSTGTEVKKKEEAPVKKQTIRDFLKV